MYSPEKTRANPRVTGKGNPHGSAAPVEPNGVSVTDTDATRLTAPDGSALIDSPAGGDPRPVPPDRAEEFGQLVRLLMDHAAVTDGSTRLRAEWIARSALEPGHLWYAMGVADRSEIRRIMHESFPELEAQNDRDMRWKKFLYRRLCGWGGFST